MIDDLEDPDAAVRVSDHISMEVTYNKADRSMVITLTAKTEAGARAIKRMRGEDSQ